MSSQRPNGFVTLLKKGVRYCRRTLRSGYTHFLCRFCGKPYEDKRFFGDLKKYGVYWKNFDAREDDKVLYFTFDIDWINPDNIGSVLDTLKEKQVPATFFLIGQGMENHPDYLQRFAAEGHAVGNHTMNHPDLTKCFPEEVAAELTQCEELYHQLTGLTMPKINRPPYGAFNLPLVRQLHKLGQLTFHWNLHYVDFMDDWFPSHEYIFDYLESHLNNGAIVLQHTSSNETTEYLGEIIDYCRSAGYRFAPLQEFVDF